MVIAYGDATGSIGSGQLQLTVAESNDGGATWSTKFTTSSATRSSQPALAIMANGTIGFLYDNYDPNTDELSQHLLTTANDFATTQDTILASESNATPIADFDPYLGDFFDLIGNGTLAIHASGNTENVVFLANGAGGLVLDDSAVNPQFYKGKISSFGGAGHANTSQFIELGSVAFSSGMTETYSGGASSGTLTVSSGGSAVAEINFVGGYPW